MQWYTKPLSPACVHPKVSLSMSFFRPGLFIILLLFIFSNYQFPNMLVPLTNAMPALSNLWSKTLILLNLHRSWLQRFLLVKWPCIGFGRQTLVKKAARSAEQDQPLIKMNPWSVGQRLTLYPTSELLTSLNWKICRWPKKKKCNSKILILFLRQGENIVGKE